jgi:hypothetical protein
VVDRRSTVELERATSPAWPVHTRLHHTPLLTEAAPAVLGQPLSLWSSTCTPRGRAARLAGCAIITSGTQTWHGWSPSSLRCLWSELAPVPVV